jgi:hypothetical protein
MFSHFGTQPYFPKMVDHQLPFWNVWHGIKGQRFNEFSRTPIFRHYMSELAGSSGLHGKQNNTHANAQISANKSRPFMF